ncbi:MAG: FAD-dependent oxidoreductase [Anaerolineae bacterium]
MDRGVESEGAVLVIGAGPAGIFTAQALAEDGIPVVLLNRDIKPGGLAEYGIYHSKHRIKNALRNQFRKILSAPEITYYGNVTVATDGDVTLAQLLEMGFCATVVAVGAQGTKWLGLPGEDLRRVHHAKDLIYHYNDLPPFSTRSYEIGRRVALIGVGNVMADIAHWLVRDIQVDEVVAVARRGPAEVKFTRQELAYVAANLDQEALDREIERVSDRMQAVDQDPEAARSFILSALEKAPDPVSDTRVRFRFLSAPSRILDDGSGAVGGVELENTRLVRNEEGETRPQRLDTFHVIDVDTVVFCIGDKVSETFGLPVAWYSFVKHPEPCYPVQGVCFEAYDPEVSEPVEGVFVVGWAREASKGQVGLARKDARDCAQAIERYLSTRSPSTPAERAQATLKACLERLDKPIVDKSDALRLMEIEAREAEARDEPGFKFKTNAEMLAALQKAA